MYEVIADEQSPIIIDVIRCTNCNLIIDNSGVYKLAVNILIFTLSYSNDS